MVTLGILYYSGEYIKAKPCMTFTPDISEAFQYWNRESAEKCAKKCGGKVIKFMEVE